MSRPPLVLIHGWGMCPTVWDALCAELDPAWQVHRLTLPGHGPDAPVAAGGTLSEWADALLPAIPEGAMLCGWSLGAMLAMAIAHRAPTRVSRLALLGATPSFVQRPGWPSALDTDTVEGFRSAYAADPAKTRKRFVALQAMGEADRRGMAQALTAALAEGDVATQADGLRILAEADLRAIIPAIRQPVRLLHGAHDALMPEAAAIWLADTLPEGRLSVFDDAGHAPLISRARDCAVLLQGFADD